MGNTAIEMRGLRFGRYVVIDRAPTPPGARQKQARWVCRCDCGTIRIRKGNDLRSGNSRSCGCLNHEETSARNFRHGSKDTKTYNAWCGAKQRCFYPDNKRFADYGGRGITMCEAWKNDFLAFLADMGHRPVGRTLERIDTNGNYEPGNCYWATPREQKHNQRNSKRVDYGGVLWNLKSLAQCFGISYTKLRYRHVLCGLPIEEAIHHAH